MNIKMMHRATASLLIGLCGALVMLGIVVDICFRGAKNCLTGITSEIIFAFVGAAIAGAVFSWFFGQNGRKGWGLASVGALLCTALGAAVGTGLEMGPENALIGIVFVYEVLMVCL